MLMRPLNSSEIKDIETIYGKIGSEGLSAITINSLFAPGTGHVAILTKLCKAL